MLVMNFLLLIQNKFPIPVARTSAQPNKYRAAVENGVVAQLISLDTKPGHTSIRIAIFSTLLITCLF